MKAQSPSQIVDDRFFDGVLDERPTVAHHSHARHNYNQGNPSRGEAKCSHTLERK